eukprot:6760-Heterococcus_DN1.PRE.2
MPFVRARALDLLSMYDVETMTFRSPTEAFSAGSVSSMVRHALEGVFSWAFGHTDPVYDDNVDNAAKTV